MTTEIILSPDPYEVLLGQVRQRLQSMNDPEMDEWFIETLAAYLGIPIVSGDADSMVAFRKMGTVGIVNLVVVDFPCLFTLTRKHVGA